MRDCRMRGSAWTAYVSKGSQASGTHVWTPRHLGACVAACMPEAWHQPRIRGIRRPEFGLCITSASRELLGPGACLAPSNPLRSFSPLHFLPLQCPTKTVVPPSRGRAILPRAPGTIFPSLLRSNAYSTDFLSSHSLPMSFLNAQGRPVAGTGSLFSQMQRALAGVDRRSTRNVSSGRYVIQTGIIYTNRTRVSHPAFLLFSRPT